jgi:hypothetical protein
MPTEIGRHRLYEKIKDEWGEEQAAELMSYLPPVGWADVATRNDLTALATTIDAEFDSKIDGLRADLHRELGNQLRWIVGTTLTAMVVLTALFAIVVGVLG